MLVEESLVNSDDVFCEWAEIYRAMNWFYSSERNLSPAEPQQCICFRAPKWFYNHRHL